MVSHWISLVWCTFGHEIHCFGALSCSGGGAPPPTTRVAPLPRGVRTPHATDGASGGGGGVALRLAGGVASELPALLLKHFQQHRGKLALAQCVPNVAPELLHGHVEPSSRENIGEVKLRISKSHSTHECE